MAASTTHAAFPSRAYNSGLGRSTLGQTGYGQASATPYQASQTPFGAPQSTIGGGGAVGTAAGATTQQQREAQRLERERREAEDRNALESLSDEHREEIDEAFSLFDLDKDSCIDYHELKVALKALGFDLPKAELLSIMQTHGTPATSLSGQAGKAGAAGERPSFTGPSRLLISLATFQHIAAQRIRARDPRDEILRAFDLFDSEGTGLIRLDDLRRVARELGEGLQEEELQAMIDEFDVRNEGGIGREEFLGICWGG